jgi:hypothetical protein
MGTHANLKGLEMNQPTAGDDIDHRIETLAVTAELDEVVAHWRSLRDGAMSLETFNDFMESNYGMNDEE